MKPLLFVTGHVPAYRVGALARLHEREQLELALFGGPLQHGGAARAELPVPHRRVSPRALYALAASGRYRAVVCPTGGRVALLAAWSGARRARLPVLLWASLWAHPRTAFHSLSYLPLARLYRSADAVVTYGPHVSAYVAARGARNVHVAPQSVDNDFWRSPLATTGRGAPLPASDAQRFLFVGRPAREKGLHVLLDAWEASRLRPPAAELLLAGASPGRPRREALPPRARAGVTRLGALSPWELREAYGACHALVVPSIATRNFREPWGLVVNEAMNRELPVIASDAVGAVAGGLVREERNGLVVPAGDAGALARAMLCMARDPALRARLGAAGARDVLAYSHDAWAAGFVSALASLGLSRERC